MLSQKHLIYLDLWGLEQCQHDTCVFVRNSSVDTSNGPREDTLIVGCYIDDLYVVYNSSDAVSLYTKFVLDLQSRWSVEDEGEVSDLLNVEITRVDGGVELRQTNYINNPNPNPNPKSTSCARTHAPPFRMASTAL